MDRLGNRLDDRFDRPRPGVHPRPAARLGVRDPLSVLRDRTGTRPAGPAGAAGRRDQVRHALGAQLRGRPVRLDGVRGVRDLGVAATDRQLQPLVLDADRDDPRLRDQLAGQPLAAAARDQGADGDCLKTDDFGRPSPSDGMTSTDRPWRKTMRKITADLFISLDGVVEAPDQWHFPYFNEEMGAAVDATLGAADTILFGRKTYASFAGAWPEREAAGGEDAPFAKSLGDARKIVVSSQKLGFTWRNSEQLEGDLVETVTALKN